MKKITLIVFIFTIFGSFPGIAGQVNTGQAPTQQTIDSLKAQIKTLETNTSKEFEERVNKQVEAQFWELAKRWGTILGVIFAPLVALLGFFGYSSGSKYLQEVIKNRVTEISDKSIIDKVTETTEKEYEKIAQKQNKLLLEYQLEKISITTGQDYKVAIRELEMLLPDTIKTENNDLISKCLDQLILMNFNAGNYEGIAKLIENYEKAYSFSYLSWANAAIAYLDLYERLGSTATVYKDWVTKGVETSLKLLPGYGTAFAVKLILLSIDYIDSISDTRKLEVKNEIDELLRKINSGSTNIVPYDTYRYLAIAQKIYAKYISELYSISSEQMTEMEAKYNDYRKSIGG